MILVGTSHAAKEWGGEARKDRERRADALTDQTELIQLGSGEAALLEKAVFDPGFWAHLDPEAMKCGLCGDSRACFQVLSFLGLAVLLR